MEQKPTHELQRHFFQERTVNIKRLKVFVSERFPEGHLIKELIGAEEDLLEATEFLRKLKIWQKLLRRNRYE